jgi:hypothetical protein
MKTKNVRVRLQDIKHGQTVYISHPVFGIDKVTIVGKPFVSKYTKSLFVNMLHSNGIIEDRSLLDAGVIGDSYNGRRTFFKLKQAQEWQRKQLKCPKFIASHERHMSNCFDF